MPQPQTKPAAKAAPARVQRREVDDLDIGPGAKLVIEPMGSDRKILTEYVGTVPGKYIITRLPLKPGAREYFLQEALLTVKYVHGGHNVSGFRTIVAGTCLKPTPLLFLEKPSSIETLNLRRSDRVNCFIPCTVYADGVEYKGLIVNVSAGGCRLVAEPSADSNKVPVIKVDSEVVINFRLVDGDQQLYARGTARSSVSGDSAATLGVQFLELADEARESIQSYVHKVNLYLMD